MTHVALSNAPPDWTTRAYASTQPWTLTSGNGTKTVYVKWRDAAGNWSAVKTDTIILDATAPTVTAPRRGLSTGPIVGGRVPVRVPWSGSDAGSGIARYELQGSTNGGAWTTLSSSITTPSASLRLATETTYRHRVRAVDKAGNTSAWATGPTFRVSRFGEANAKVTYSGSWSTQTSSSYWFGGAKRATATGARATLTMSGRTVAWVATTGPTRGKAEVWVDGARAATVDLYAATTAYQQVVWTKAWTTNASHSVQIRVLGTSGRPAVDVDGFVVLD